MRPTPSVHRPGPARPRPVAPRGDPLLRPAAQPRPGRPARSRRSAARSQQPDRRLRRPERGRHGGRLRLPVPGGGHLPRSSASRARTSRSSRCGPSGPSAASSPAPGDPEGEDGPEGPPRGGPCARHTCGELVKDHRSSPGGDMLSGLATDDGPGGRMGDVDLQITGVLLLIAGHETTVNLIANGMLTLLRNPDAQARCARTELAVPGGRGAAPVRAAGAVHAQPRRAQGHRDRRAPRSPGAPG